jgi:hypothetical protein
MVKDSRTSRTKVGHGTINEALAASAAEFKGMEDHFELVHGNGSTKLFP